MLTPTRATLLVLTALGAWAAAPPLPSPVAPEPEPLVDPPTPRRQVDPPSATGAVVLIVDRAPTSRGDRDALRQALRALAPGSVVVGEGRSGPMVLWSPTDGDVDPARTPEPYAPGGADLDRFAADVAAAWGLSTRRFAPGGGAP